MCVHGLIQKQASTTPNAVAVVCGPQQLTYSELDARANQLAHLLQARNVTTEVPVALCMNRSADFVVAALAILKAGGAYVPLDPSSPPNRISALLSDSGAPLVLTQPCLAHKLQGVSLDTIVLNDETFKHLPDSPVESATHPNHLAYIIFTSGSTGHPKGVQITHANLLNLIAWHIRAFQVTANDRATLHASTGFDAAVWELWPYLAGGASVYVVDDEVRTAAEPLRDWLTSRKITVSFQPTAMAELLMKLKWPADSSLRYLLTGADTLRQYPPAGLPFSLVNNYGPTECAVVATSAVVAPARTQELPPIGRPIDNVNVSIVDEQMHPVPSGSVGELVIGGAGVGRGYRNLPEPTAQKFIHDRLSDDPNARLYKTGDLARWLPDGQIAFLGRLDEQIKIRGFRIEPQEIASILDRHPAIQACFISPCRDGGDSEARLVAYIVSPQENLKPGDLRAFLGEHLPDYMIPSVFVRVAAIPQTANGKVDKSALPQLNAGNILSEDAYDAPQSALEERVEQIVAALLGVARVGREDNFFNLGGHSLMGAQIIAKVRDAFDVELSLRSLFDEPTVAGISLAIEELIHAKLAAMSEEEVERLLASSGK